jgi:CRISPR-associated Csx11 family protein
MTVNLDILRQHRDALLLAEVAAWLHMLGKFHEDFLNGNQDLDIQIPPDLPTTHPNLDHLLRTPWTGPIWNGLGIKELQANSLSIFDLAKEHRNPQAPTGLQRLLQDAHGRGSGIEKGVLNRFAPEQSGVVYLATAFGQEARSVELSELRTKRQALYDFLQNRLQDLFASSRNLSSFDWRGFRSGFIQRLDQDFRTTVAETRRPLNDVTLFDQTAASVAFFKAALAQNLLCGWRDPHQRNVAQKYHWQLLRIGINGSAFWGQVSRIPDLLSRKALIQSALDAVKVFLEETCPLGNEIYRDEDGSVFIVPDVTDLLKALVNGQTLERYLQELIAQALSGEATGTITLSGRTRNTLRFGEIATAELPPPAPQSSQLSQLKGRWQGAYGRDLCPVCGLRPQGPGEKAVVRKVCDTCEQRRTERSKEWTTLTTTIWTDEVADKHGRLALIVGRFGLETWLKGSALNSVLMFDPSQRELNDRERNKKYQFSYSDLLKEIQDALSPPKIKQTLGKWAPLLDNLILKNARGGFTRFVDIYDLFVSDTDLNRNTKEPELFALAILRQSPSFARLRRIWETTRTFWQEVLPTDAKRDLAASLVSQTVGQSGPRLEIIPENRNNLNLGPFHTYELVVNDIHLSVVWDDANQRFITCDNLDYLAKPEQLGRPVRDALLAQKGTELTLEEPVGYGAKNKVWGTITITDVQELPDRYVPAIPILAEPRTFMALVPADKALEVVKAIQEKYEREMGKVRNRLPLTLGVVYFGRRTPLAAALDAGRRMLSRKASPVDEWCVVADVQRQTGPLPTEKQNLSRGTRQFQEWFAVQLKHQRSERSLTWYVPAVMGDGQTDDQWYPYVPWVHDRDGKSDPSQATEPRHRYFQAPDLWTRQNVWMVHAGELKEGDLVYFTPSTFDYEFLDTTARRFEVSYDASGQRRGPERRQRPYLLEQLDELEQAWQDISRLSKSQIHAVISTIETKREMWQKPSGAGALALPGADVFRQFVCDTLREAGVYSDSLERAALSGMLRDALEIHLEIMKEELK